jgi:hypothetical protein
MIVRRFDENFRKRVQRVSPALRGLASWQVSEDAVLDTEAIERHLRTRAGAVENAVKENQTVAEFECGRLELVGRESPAQG